MAIVRTEDLPENGGDYIDKLSFADEGRLAELYGVNLDCSSSGAKRGHLQHTGEVFKLRKKIRKRRFTHFPRVCWCNFVDHLVNVITDDVVSFPTEENQEYPSILFLTLLTCSCLLEKAAEYHREIWHRCEADSLLTHTLILLNELVIGLD